jgi:hypothetical protein
LVFILEEIFVRLIISMFTKNNEVLFHIDLGEQLWFGGKKLFESESNHVRFLEESFCYFVITFFNESSSHRGSLVAQLAKKKKKLAYKKQGKKRLNENRFIRINPMTFHV